MCPYLFENGNLKKGLFLMTLKQHIVHVCVILSSIQNFIILEFMHCIFALVDVSG